MGACQLTEFVFPGSVVFIQGGTGTELHHPNITEQQQTSARWRPAAARAGAGNDEQLSSVIKGILTPTAPPTLNTQIQENHRA